MNEVSRHVVVGIEAERLREFNRSVGFSLVFELLGQFAEVVVVDKAHVVGPYRRKFFLLALCEFFNHGSGHGAELLEIEQAVALERSGLGHGFLRCEAVVFHAVNHVVEAAAFGERYVAVQAHRGFGAVYHCVVHHERLAQVVLAFSEAQEFGLEESERGVAPACARTVLVFYRSDWVFFYNCKGDTVVCCGECGANGN